MEVLDEGKPNSTLPLNNGGCKGRSDGEEQEEEEGGELMAEKSGSVEVKEISNNFTSRSLVWSSFSPSSASKS